MPWKILPMSELRLALVHMVRSAHIPVAQACRHFGVSRKTAYKWLVRYDQAPQQPLQNQLRRPRRCPRQTAPDLEQRILQVRDQHGWGARKIRAVLANQGQAVPSARTVHQVLVRHDRLQAAATEPPALQRFERAQPNELWQLDFKGPLEIQRRHVYPLVVEDDHSRFLLALRPCLDLTMATAWAVLWQAFGEYGLPEAILCDNAFGTRGQNPLGISWFEAQLIRLDIHPCHGRPYHPQTQGKVERLNGTLERELWPRVRRDTLEHFTTDLQQWRTQVYNVLRPHQALADQPPVKHWQPSPRTRPATLPPVEYASGAVLRKVMNRGDISWRGYRILIGAGLEGEQVRVEERAHEVAVYYAWKQLRLLATADLRKGTIL
jgi:transposase InsO family protein